MALVSVDIAECKVSNNPDDVLVTYALGSCIAVLLYDPVVRVAGLLHYMLPESAMDADLAIRRPCMFADTGIPFLLRSCTHLGAQRSRAIFMAVGGAHMLESNESFSIGERNRNALKNICRESAITIHTEDIGGTASRTVQIDVAHGRVQLSLSAGSKKDRIVDLSRIGAGNISQPSRPR
jgi:chemotaxis protein CheD